MGNFEWMLIVVIAYMPMFYRIQRRISKLEDEVMQLKRMSKK